MAASPVELWQQLLAAPGDEQGKTRYVNALVEEGDRRAEVLLVGAEIKRLRSIHQSHLTHDLVAHYETLLPVWRTSFDAAAEQWQATVDFVFGWPAELTLAASDFVRHAAAIVATLPVRHLNLSAVKDAPEVFALPQFSQIASLRAKEQPWANRTVQALADSPHPRALRWLDLSKTGLNDRQVEILAAAPNLRGLVQFNLDGNPCHNPTDAALGCGYDGITGCIVPESVSLPAFGRELESRHGELAWLHVLNNYGGPCPEDRYTF